MSSQRLHQVGTHLIRVAFVAVFATMLATSGPVSAAALADGGATTIGCASGRH